MISSTLHRFNISTTAKQYVILFLLLLFALCYYGSYYRCSLYPASEGGIEGVIALRLLAGKTPFLETALNYNLFWFYPIVVLFKIFGPSYTALRIFFFFLATLTGLLSFYVVRLATRHLGAATLTGLLTLLLPGQLFRNYMSFLVMLNMALFLRAFFSFHSTLQKRLLWIRTAGLALSLTFLIRVDLGFFLSLIFIALALFVPWINLDKNKTVIPVTHRFYLSLAALTLGISSFFALHIPVYLYAQYRGFAPYFIAQYQQYPHMIISQGSRLFQTIFPPSHCPSPTIHEPQSPILKSHFSYSTSSSSLNVTKTPLLRRSFFSTDLREKITALNLYLPIITSLLLVLIATGYFFQHQTHCFRCSFQLLTSLGCSLTLFPQYFFWRPDMVHLSEFMVPMTPTIIIALFFSWKTWPNSKKIFKIIIALFLFFGITTLSLYFINGCQSQSTGGIAISEGRTKEFLGENSVHVKLKSHEWEEASAIYHSILQHSLAGEYVVCFPYNPEINFMTNRPSYRYDLYCDDVTAPKNFDQIAIHEIETFHPAVIVITNWPINGTEHSRFSNWAATTYNYIQSHYKLDYYKGIIQVFIRQ